MSLPISSSEAEAVQDSLLVLLTGLLESALELATSAQAPSLMMEIASLCEDARSVADLAVALHTRADNP